MRQTSVYKIIVLAGYLLLFIFTLGYLMVDVWDPDFWWHLATGKWIVENGRLPDEDPFSFTTLHKDIYFPIDRVKFNLTHSWLAQVILYKIYTLWGFEGVSLFRALILTLTLIIVVLLLRYYRAHPAVILLGFTAGLFLIKGFTNERPQLFSILFVAILLYILERARNKRPLIALAAIPLMVFWSNLHPGYIYGGVIIFIYIASGWLRLLLRRKIDSYMEDKRYHIIFTLILLCSTLTSFINPNTFYAYVNAFLPETVSINLFIQEYQPTLFFYKDRPLVFILIIIISILMAVNIRRLEINDLVLFIFATLLALSAIRFIVFFAVSGSFLLGKYLNLLIDSLRLNRKRYFNIASFAFTLIVFLGLLFFHSGIKIDRMFMGSVGQGLYPFGATGFIKNALPKEKRLFNPYGWGGFLIWRLYPDFKVFIDGRLLNPEIFLQYREVIMLDKSQKHAGKPKWKGILDGYGIDYILLAPLMEFASDWHLISAITNDNDWRLIYCDEISLIFIRDKEEFRDIIKRHNLPSDLAYTLTSWQALEKAKAEKKKTKKIEYYLVAADAFLRMNRTEKARECLKKIIELDPENPWAKSYEKAIGLE